MYTGRDRLYTYSMNTNVANVFSEALFISNLKNYFYITYMHFGVIRFYVSLSMCGRPMLYSACDIWASEYEAQQEMHSCMRTQWIDFTDRGAELQQGRGQGGVGAVKYKGSLCLYYDPPSYGYIDAPLDYEIWSPHCQFGFIYICLSL